MGVSLLIFLSTACATSQVPNAAEATQFTYDAKGKRDPFVPLVTPDGRLLKLDEEAGGDLNLSLEGIIYDKNGISYAVVNGAVLKTGDKIGDYRVLRIEERKVAFIRDGQTQEIELTKEGE